MFKSLKLLLSIDPTLWWNRDKTSEQTMVHRDFICGEEHILLRTVASIQRLPFLIDSVYNMPNVINADKVV